MPYRRTERVVRRLAAREQAILEAARALAVEHGMAAVQIAAVAKHAGIAAGTVYRYFPSKADLVAALIAALAAREIEAMRKAADAAPGPLSALAASIATFAARALRQRKLAWAAIAEPVDAEIDALRLDFRQSLAAEFEIRIRTAIAGGLCPSRTRASRRRRSSVRWPRACWGRWCRPMTSRRRRVRRCRWRRCWPCAPSALSTPARWAWWRRWRCLNAQPPIHAAAGRPPSPRARRDRL